MARANGTRSKHALVVQGRLDGSGPAAVLVAVVLPMQATSEIPWKKRFESKDRDKNGEIEPADLFDTLSPGLAKRFSAREVRMRERGMTSANYREFLERDGNGDFKVSKSEFRTHLIDKERRWALCIHETPSQVISRSLVVHNFEI